MRIVLIMLLMLNLATAKKIALVIGNGDYNQGHLANPTKDADLIAQNLRDVGFTVTIKKNLSTALKMEEAIDDFAKIVKDDDIAVIYYAGHGVQCKGRNYLIPTKATINRGGQLPSKSLDLDVVIGAVSDIKLAIIMLDACRNNTYPSCSKSQTRGLVQPKVNSAGGMIISFATAENTEASDGDEHSPYALALSKFMNQSLPIETYFREVGGEVLSSSGQQPMFKSSFYGRFSFGNSSSLPSITNSIGMKFIDIPSGYFMMGANKNFDKGLKKEFPQHKVNIKSFYMQTTEVTQEQWFNVMGSNPSYFKARDNPVESISGNDIKKFIEKLNQIEKNSRYRLPTNAEWEYAIKAGTNTIYYFGDSVMNADLYGWSKENAKKRTHIVGQKKPNKWGLYDMFGNVWEVVEDCTHKNYLGAPSDGSAWINNCKNNTKVLRGGSWYYSNFFARSASFGGDVETKRSRASGFRLVKEK